MTTLFTLYSLSHFLGLSMDQINPSLINKQKERNKVRKQKYKQKKKEQKNQPKRPTKKRKMQT